MSSENHVISFEPPQRAHKREHATSKASKLRPKGLFGGLQEPQEGRNKHPKEAQEAPKDSPREPKDAPRPSKLQPRCLKKATKMQFAMHFLNVVHQNGVSNGFPKVCCDFAQSGPLRFYGRDISSTFAIFSFSGNSVRKSATFQAVLVNFARKNTKHVPKTLARQTN